MDEVLRVSGVALLCTFCLLIVGKGSATMGAALRVGGGLAIFGVMFVLVASQIGELREIFMSAPVNGTYFEKAFSLMIKALGIALLSRFCADICRDCGESALASGVEGVGRLAIFSLCVPVLSDIMEYASKILSMGD